MKLEVKEIEKILRKAWCRETSASNINWNKSNPAYGQCAVTALIVQDYFGGKILRARLKDKNFSHYWNVLPDGKEIDLTRSQFPKNYKIPKGKVVSRNYILNSKKAKQRKTRERYLLLKKRIKDFLKNK